MNQKTFSLVASMIFLSIVLVHALRLALGWHAEVNTWTVPMWVSWAALVITLYLASEGFLFGAKKHDDDRKHNVRHD